MPNLCALSCSKVCRVQETADCTLQRLRCMYYRGGLPAAAAVTDRTWCAASRACCCASNSWIITARGRGLQPHRSSFAFVCVCVCVCVCLCADSRARTRGVVKNRGKCIGKYNLFYFYSFLSTLGMLLVFTIICAFVYAVEPH